MASLFTLALSAGFARDQPHRPFDGNAHGPRFRSIHRYSSSSACFSARSARVRCRRALQRTTSRFTAARVVRPAGGRVERVQCAKAPPAIIASTTAPATMQATTAVISATSCRGQAFAVGSAIADLLASRGRAPGFDLPCAHAAQEQRDKDAAQNSTASRSLHASAKPAGRKLGTTSQNESTRCATSSSTASTQRGAARLARRDSRTRNGSAKWNATRNQTTPRHRSDAAAGTRRSRSADSPPTRSGIACRRGRSRS